MPRAAEALYAGGRLESERSIGDAAQLQTNNQRNWARVLLELLPNKKRKAQGRKTEGMKTEGL